MRRGEPMTEEERARGLSNIFVDSGAYAELTQGIEANVDLYCDRLIANPSLKLYANLDVIDHEDPERGAMASYQNYRHMRSRGLDPVPAFHAGEDFPWLQTYIDEGCSYIALGGVASTHSTVQRNWAFFNQCFKIIGKAGRPIKTHVFGVAHEATLVHYPFASADSASWLIRAQKARNSDISRLGDRAWRASLYEPENNHRLYAAMTFLEALDANRLERQIRENPERRDFNFFLVVPKVDNDWWLAALWVVHHRNALVSNGPNWNPTLVKQFIDDPLSVLARPRIAAKLALLEEMKVRYYEYLNEQRRLQWERDRVA
jgi:hypothetical protein